MENRKGIFDARVAQKGINAMWFANKNDEGVIYSGFFNPFPATALALVYTAVRSVIFYVRQADNEVPD